MSRVQSTTSTVRLSAVLLDAASSSCNPPVGLSALTPRTSTTRCPRRCRSGVSLALQLGHSTLQRLYKLSQLARFPSPLDRYRQLHLSFCPSMTLTAQRPQSHPDPQPGRFQLPDPSQRRVRRALAPKAPVWIPSSHRHRCRHFPTINIGHCHRPWAFPARRPPWTGRRVLLVSVRRPSTEKQGRFYWHH